MSVRVYLLSFQTYPITIYFCAQRYAFCFDLQLFVSLFQLRHRLFEYRARCADVYTNEAATLLTKCRAIVHANASLVGPEVDHLGVLQTHFAAIEPHQERTLLFVVANFGAVLFEELTYVVDVGGDVLHHLV